MRRGRRLWLQLVAVLALTWLAGLVWFAETIPHEPPAPGTPEAERHTDAIVVLTGGSERLAAGLELLSEGKAGKLFVSGVYHSVDVRELLHLTRLKPAEAECCIVLGYAADNTIGNAAETAAWMHAEHFTSLRLVTASYHMRRSLWEFHQAMPGVRIVPHPVFPETVRAHDWWLWPGTAGLLAMEYSKYLAVVFHVRSTPRQVSRP